MNKEYRVALVLYTQGLDYDDRVRKEILSIQKNYENVKFTIFAITPCSNKEEEGVTSYGVPYKLLYLKTRDKYPSASHTFAKAWDFFKTVKREVNSFDAVWCADMETLLCVLLLRGKPIVWDLHELLIGRKSNRIKKIMFILAAKRAKVMIHANKPRLDYLIDTGLIKSASNQFVLRNYPQFLEIDGEYDEKYKEFIKWLGNDKCVYLQGLMSAARADVESIEAVLAFSDLKAVVIGNTVKERMDNLKERFGEDFERRVFFTGQIKQLKTPQYIKKCCMSLIFYKNSSANNWYCEPNRLFQNLVNGIPVVVGNNPPMRELVEKYGVGVCSNTDGSNVREIINSIKELYSNIIIIKEKVEEHKHDWLWDSQDDIIKQIVNLSFLR